MWLLRLLRSARLARTGGRVAGKPQVLVDRKTKVGAMWGFHGLVGKECRSEFVFSSSSVAAVYTLHAVCSAAAIQTQSSIANLETGT